MNIERYRDAVLDGLEKRGFTEAKLRKAPSEGIDVYTRITIAFISGRSVSDVVDSLARRLQQHGDQT